MTSSEVQRILAEHRMDWNSPYGCTCGWLNDMGMMPLESWEAHLASVLREAPLAGAGSPSPQHERSLEPPKNGCPKCGGSLVTCDYVHRLDCPDSLFKLVGNTLVPKDWSAPFSAAPDPSAPAVPGGSLLREAFIEGAAFKSFNPQRDAIDEAFRRYSSEPQDKALSEKPNTAQWEAFADRLLKLASGTLTKRDIFEAATILTGSPVVAGGEAPPSPNQVSAPSRSPEAKENAP